MPFLPKFVELPKGHPDALFSIPDRPGLHKEPERTTQTLALPYRSRSQRRPIQALDMPLTRAQRERLYLTDSRAPADGRLVRFEQRSPSHREKRVSIARSPRTPIIVEPRSPSIYAEDTFARLPDFHPAQLPKPDPYPVFIHAQQPPTSKQAKYESESEALSTDSEDNAKYEVHTPPRRQRRHRKQRVQQEEPEIIYETERYKRREETDYYPPVEVPRRSRSYRDSGRDDHTHRRRAYHHHRSHHRSASRPRQARSEPDRQQDFIVPAPSVPRSRRAAASNPDRHRDRSTDVKGMLEDPRDVRQREMVAERRIFGERDGKKVKQTQYQYR